MRPLLAAVLALAFAAGCTMSLRPLAAQRGEAVVSVVPSVVEGAYRTQAVVTKNTTSAVEHVVVKLFALDGSTETAAAEPLDVAKADLGRVIRFKLLNMNTTYRVRGYAYKAAGTADADLISKDAYVDVQVGIDPSPTLAKLSIPLADVTFSGNGTSSIEVKTGAVTDAGTLSVVLPERQVED